MKQLSIILLLAVQFGNVFSAQASDQSIESIICTSQQSKLRHFVIHLLSIDEEESDYIHTVYHSKINTWAGPRQTPHTLIGSITTQPIRTRVLYGRSLNAEIPLWGSIDLEEIEYSANPEWKNTGFRGHWQGKQGQVIEVKCEYINSSL